MGRKSGVTQANSRRRMIEEIRATARFGNFPIPREMSPIDVLIDEMKRSAGFCFWIESKMAVWKDELIDLKSDNVDDKGSVQQLETNERIWLGIWQSERGHLAKVAKLCIDAGVDERVVQLAERQGEMMFEIITRTLGLMQLSPEQEAQLPKIMPAIIRQISPMELDNERGPVDSEPEWVGRVPDVMG